MYNEVLPIIQGCRTETVWNRDLKDTVAAKSIRTPAVSPSDSSVKDPFLPSHNSAKKRFQDVKKNQ